ncbi:MAG TPA: metallopeptidase TldD-related protein [Casimicrobiaceae bacterium]|nr:metallopeptidase TldD-related protein [Casimicrobiaceae bacterium]
MNDTTIGAVAVSTRELERANFNAIATALDHAIGNGERYTAWLEGESSDFVRMNRGKVRQAGHVEQRILRVQLVRGARHASHCLTLEGDAAKDCNAAVAAIDGLRSALPELADDPYLMLPDSVQNSDEVRADELPNPGTIIESVLDAARGEDLVGIYAAGPVWRAFANSEGQRNWHLVTTFNLDWSLYYRADKAVKSMLAGFAWSDETLRAKMELARERLALIARPPKSLEPGRYRAFLAPSAMEEVVSLLRWGAFSGRGLATQQSALTRMESGEKLDPRMTICEDFAGGVAPRFQSAGFTRPARVPLVEKGALVGSLVSPRTAREFDLTANGANEWESPESIAIEGGTLMNADALSALDRGLFVGNLWYTNYSDRNACRMTGMTRFATFWVEDGKIVAPINVMRFDDSLYRILGTNLEALTDTPELMLSSESYGSRHLTSVKAPGVLVSEMEFTL